MVKATPNNPRAADVRHADCLSALLYQNNLLLILFNLRMSRRQPGNRHPVG